jgi:hypothetical protein
LADNDKAREAAKKKNSGAKNYGPKDQNKPKDRNIDPEEKGR